MAYYSVLRIGPLFDDNAALLRSAISSHFKASSPSTDDSSATEDQLTISNRYFDASVLLKGLDESISLPTNDALIQEDGIVLIFDASEDAHVSQSFDCLSPHHESAIQAEKAGELLRLCVGVSFGPSPLSDGSKKSEEEYSRRVLWCLDRGYEYVEVDLSEEGMKKGHDERDKEGFARVVEAISTCMWSSHVMKPRDGVSKVKQSTERTVVSENKPAEQANKLDSACNNIDDKSREAAAMASLMDDVDDAQQHTSQEEIENRQQELAFHQLEQVINEAKQIREASQSDSISDEERRQRAGDTAVKLMGLLERFGFDDDGDDDDEVP